MGRAPGGPGMWLEVLTGGNPGAVDGWYAGGRLDALRTLPAATAVHRWRECGGGPRRAAVVDLEDVAAARPAFTPLPPGVPALDTAPAFQARGLLCGALGPWVGEGDADHADAPILFLIVMAVDPEAEAEYNRWYDAEHIPFLLEQDGWLAARRYRCDSPAGEYVTLYRAAHPRIVTAAARTAVRRTAWSRRMLGGTFATHTRGFFERDG